MDVYLQIMNEDAQHQHLLNLAKWLMNEPEFRGRVTLSPAAIRQGEMGGGVAGALTVALASGGACTVLASTISVWLKEKKSDLMVQITLPDGARTKLTASGPAADLLVQNLVSENKKVSPQMPFDEYPEIVPDVRSVGDNENR